MTGNLTSIGRMVFEFIMLGHYGKTLTMPDEVVK